MDHVREHRSVLAAAEKRLLIRIAHHLPSFINSDHLSGLALLSMLAAGPTFALIGSTRWAAPAFIGLLILNWFGDSLDGTLARVRDQQRPKYGYYVDHVIDLAGTAALLFGMAASGLMTPAIAFALLAVYFMVAAESFLGTHALGVFRMSFAGFGPTELRILLAIGALKVASNPVVHIAGMNALLLDVGGVIAIVGLVGAFVVSAFRNGAALYRADPLPRSTADPTPRTPRTQRSKATNGSLVSFVSSRPWKYFVVSAAGFAVQLVVLAALVTFDWSWFPATVLAVECAIVHNYFWHRRWTWDDRHGSFLRFNASAAVTSIGGNVALMAVLVGAMGLPVVLANVIAVGVMSVANFVIGDRWVFAAMLCLMVLPVQAEAAPNAETITAWNQYVASAETRIAAERLHPLRQPPDGRTIDVGSGTISDWRGSVFIPQVTLDAFLYRLQHPGTPPPQTDVTASRVLARGPDALHLYIRLVRTAIVTVTYDTEHEMAFRRVSPMVAVARSVATRIEEVGGGDKGFLWRLNSYWHYEQTNGGVAVSLESLTLSRDVPILIKPLAGRIVPRIARESMVRTLDALRAYFA